MTKGTPVDLFNPASTTTAAIFACSPRAGGNSDHAAQFIARGIHDAGGKARVVNMRQFRITPCLGCGRCEFDPDGHCFQASDDQSGPLYQVLLSSPLVVFCSPIYFYHLPSGFKAFIDRSQSYYLRMQNKDPELIALPRRPASVCLVAGRPVGDKLFDGALLTLRYFMEPFNRYLEEPMTLRGLDAPDDLEESEGMEARLREHGGLLWTRAMTHVSPQPAP